jgi:hypothetical protein
VLQTAHNCALRKSRAAGACGRGGAGLRCRPSSDNALSMEEGTMSEFFTRETWRAGGRSKLRKRVNPYAGCKTAPVAFLAAAKLAAIKPGRSNRRLCGATKRNGEPCRRLAMKGCKGCESHGGILALAKQGKLQSSGRTAAFKAARAAAVEGRSPQVSLELTGLSVYQKSNDRTRARLARAWQTEAWSMLVRQIQSQDI